MRMIGACRTMQDINVVDLVDHTQSEIGTDCMYIKVGLNPAPTVCAFLSVVNEHPEIPVIIVLTEPTGPAILKPLRLVALPALVPYANSALRISTAFAAPTPSRLMATLKNADDVAVMGSFGRTLRLELTTGHPLAWANVDVPVMPTS
jgi:hypothetical protein